MVAIVKGNNKNKNSTVVDNDSFKSDLGIVLKRVEMKYGSGVAEELGLLRDKLVKLREQRKGELKINHSVMELVAAAYLINLGYDVDVEHQLDKLTCDLYGVYGESHGKNIIMEIETGFVPPENALDPVTSCRAKVASKIVRYNKFSKEFSLGTPPNNILEIPRVFLKPPKLRKPEEAEAVCKLCEPYYTNPPIRSGDVINARFDGIYVIDVDNVAVRPFSVAKYVRQYRTL